MSKRYLLSMDTLKTIGQGALGAITFGIYHRSTTNKMMEINNENQDLHLLTFQMPILYYI
jgi:hypothetical protein